MNIKVISILALAIMMASCSNQELLDSDSPKPAPQQTSNIRSYEEALQIAQSSIQMVDGQAQTRAASPRKIALNDTKVCKLDAKTRTSSDVNDTLMYVFNFEDNQGFAIISANKNTEALIAVTEKGHYDPAVRSDNESFNFYMDMAKKHIASTPRFDPGLIPDDPIYEIVDTTFYLYGQLQITPYVTVKWGQQNPEGELCSNGKCGCANTAMAQIMSYYEYPASIEITYGDNPFTQNLNWTGMKAHVKHPQQFICLDYDYHIAISRLCRQLGEDANSNYGSNGTSTDISDVTDCMSYYGYNTSGWLSYFSEYANVYDNLIDEKLYIICGWNSDDRGHAWVLDGFQNISYQHVLARKPLGGFMWEILEIYDYGELDLYHFNWGWDGDCNGYFSTNVFDTTGGTFYDTGSHNHQYNLNYYVQLQCVYPASE